MSNRESSIINDLAIRIANLEIEKAGLAADLNQVNKDYLDLQKMHRDYVSKHNVEEEDVE